MNDRWDAEWDMMQRLKGTPLERLIRKEIELREELKNIQNQIKSLRSAEDV